MVRKNIGGACKQSCLLSGDEMFWLRQGGYLNQDKYQ